YTVGGGLCTTATASATVTVTAASDAGTDGTLNACITDTSIDLLGGLGGTPGVGTWTDNDASGALSGNMFNPSAAGLGTFTFTYTVGGGTSDCPADTAVVTVVVSASANAGTFIGIQNVCSSAGTFDLQTLLSGAQPGGTWTDVSGTSATNPLSLTGLTAGTFSYTYTITGNCGSDSEIVQFTLLQSPSLENGNIAAPSACVGQDIVVQFSGMA